MTRFCNNSMMDDPRVETVRYFVLVLYLATFVFGLVGNSLTILVLIGGKKIKNVASCFILNLAIADDLFVICLPFTAYSTFVRNWVFGSIVCKMLNAFWSINLYASIYIMTLMSVDRYLAVVHPLKSIRYRTSRNVFIVCVVIWTSCFVISTPLWMYSEVSSNNQSVRCSIHWPDTTKLEHLWFWTMFELCLCFVLPIIVMTVCYSRLLYCVIKKTIDSRRGQGGKSPLRRVTTMVFIVSFVFVVCWSPYHVMKVVGVYKTQTVDPSRPPVPDMRYTVLYILSQVLVYISSCCNPFIYFITSTDFRKYLLYNPIVYIVIIIIVVVVIIMIIVLVMSS